MDGTSVRIARASNFLIFVSALCVPLLLGPVFNPVFESFTLAAVIAVALYRVSQLGIWLDADSVIIQNFWHVHRLPRYRTQVEVEGIEGHTGSFVFDAAHAIKGKPVFDIPRMSDDNSPSDSLRISLIDPANHEDKIRPSCILGTPRGKMIEVCEDLIAKIASRDLP